jgi:ribosome-associated protein
VPATEHARELALTAAQAAADKKATDVVILDVADTIVITDAFLVATGSNERQVQSIVDAIEESLLGLPEKVKPVRREGERAGRWVLLDYVDLVVHVQHEEERDFYALDRLWKDCPTIPFVDRDAPGVAAGTRAAGSDPAPANGADAAPANDSDAAPAGDSDAA